MRWILLAAMAAATACTSDGGFRYTDEATRPAFELALAQCEAQVDEDLKDEIPDRRYADVMAAQATLGLSEIYDSRQHRRALVAGCLRQKGYRVGRGR